jgi:hypothetical protein
MQLVWEKPRERFGLLQIYGLMGLGALLVARFIPVAVIFRPVWGCPFRRHTGFPCLGCGMTRAFDYTTHGRFADAFRTTPLGALVPWICAIVGVWGLVTLCVRAPIPSLQMSDREGRLVRLSIVGLILSNWVYMVLTRPGAA